MQLDLNKPFTTENVAQLLGSKDDSCDRQLRVTKDGIAFLSDEVGADNIAGLAFRFETWDARNDYTGLRAAENPVFVRRIETVLRREWPNPSRRYIESY